MLHGLNNNYIYAVSKITVYYTNGVEEISSLGTGFFIAKDEKLFFITNRHVVDIAYGDSAKYAAYKLKYITIDKRRYIPETKSVEIEEWQIESCNINYPEEFKDDIACISNIRIPSEPINLPNYIDFKMLATVDNFENDLYIYDSLALIGFPIVFDHKNNTPIVRSGIISSDPRLDYSYNGEFQGHVLAYEAFSTSGASGSPVFATQRGFKVGAGLNAPDGFYRPVLLIGINAKSLKIGEEHQHMSCLFKSNHIIELINKVLSN